MLISGPKQKKYEKAKDRFKLQRAKHEDAMKKAQKDYMENEKRHWRSVALVQEEAGWERLLRVRASEVLEFVEIERRFQVEELERTHARELQSRLRRDSPLSHKDVISMTVTTQQIEYHDCAIEDEDMDDEKPAHTEQRLSLIHI